MRKRTLSLLFISAAIQLPCPGQRFSFQTYGESEGLSNPTPLSIMQDKAGFIWTGTQNGLFRYDGTRFEEFYTADGLPSSEVIGLFQDSSGTIFASTSAGIARLSSRRFVAIRARGSPLITTHREGIAMGPDGRLYVASPQGLLVVRGEDPDSRAEYIRQPADAEIFSVYADRNGTVWAGCGQRLCIAAGQQLAEVAPELPHDGWSGIREDRAGNLWVIGGRTIAVRDRGSRRFRVLPRLPGNLSFSPFLGDAMLDIDRDDAAVVTTEQGLCRWTARGWQAIGAAAGLRSDVTAALVDSEGSLWAGVAGVGLERWLGYGEWEHWTTAEGLPHDAIWAIHRDAGGTVWVGTRQGLAFARGSAAAPLRFNARPELASKMVLALAHSRDNSLWIGTGQDGVFRIAAATGKFSPVRVRPNGPRWAMQVFVDRDDYVWSTALGEVYRSVSPAGTGIPAFQLQPVPGVRPDERFHMLIEDREGRIWISGTEGLVRFDHGRWTRFTERDGLLERSVAAMTAAPDGGIWIGYHDALGITRVPPGRPGASNGSSEHGNRPPLEHGDLPRNRCAWVHLGRQ